MYLNISVSNFSENVSKSCKSCCGRNKHGRIHLELSISLLFTVLKVWHKFRVLIQVHWRGASFPEVWILNVVEIFWRKWMKRRVVKNVVEPIAVFDDRLFDKFWRFLLFFWQEDKSIFERQEYIDGSRSVYRISLNSRGSQMKR